MRFAGSTSGMPVLYVLSSGILVTHLQSRENARKLLQSNKTAPSPQTPNEPAWNYLSRLLHGDMGSPVKPMSKMDDEEDEEYFPGRMPEGEGGSPTYDIFVAVTAVSESVAMTEQSARTLRVVPQDLLATLVQIFVCRPLLLITSVHLLTISSKWYIPAGLSSMLGHSSG